MINKQFYTRAWPSGEKCIFQYKGEGRRSDDMVEVYMFCSNYQEEYNEHTEITISQKGTGKDSVITEASEEDINFLMFIKANWKWEQSGHGHLNLPYEQIEKLYETHEIPVPIKHQSVKEISRRVKSLFPGKREGGDGWLLW